MIYQIKGQLVKKEENRVIVDSQGLLYEIHIPRTVYRNLNHSKGEPIELIIYHYFNIDKNRGIPVLIGFTEELQRDFFEKFIGVSGVGPKAAIRAFDKPLAVIAKAIEEGDVDFLKTLAGVGKQRAKQIVAHLQGKVGRFALIKDTDKAQEPKKGELINEAREVLKRLQYNTKESEQMIKRALGANPEIDNIEELLNEIYRQRK